MNITDSLLYGKKAFIFDRELIRFHPFKVKDTQFNESEFEEILLQRNDIFVLGAKEGEDLYVHLYLDEEPKTEIMKSLKIISQNTKLIAPSGEIALDQDSNFWLYFTNDKEHAICSEQCSRIKPGIYKTDVYSQKINKRALDKALDTKIGTGTRKLESFLQSTLMLLGGLTFYFIFALFILFILAFFKPHLWSTVAISFGLFALMLSFVAALDRIPYFKRIAKDSHEVRLQFPNIFIVLRYSGEYESNISNNNG